MVNGRDGRLQNLPEVLEQLCLCLWLRLLGVLGLMALSLDASGRRFDWSSRMLGDDVAIALVVVSHGDVAGPGPRVFGRKSRNKGRRVVLWIGSCPSFCAIADSQQYRTSIVGQFR